ncbi:MAG TPA: hypothetical protein VF516_33390 [Kofleriaceae bacterium]
MKRSLIATLFLITMIAVASGSRAAPSAAPEAPQIGSCRWFCTTTGKAFSTASACATACGGPAACDEVC